MKRPLYEKCKLLKTVLFQTLKSSFIVTLKLLFDFESYFQNKSIFKVTTKIQLCDFCQTCVICLSNCPKTLVKKSSKASKIF